MFSLIPCLFFSCGLVLPVLSWFCLLSFSMCRLPWRIFIMVAWWSFIVLVSACCGRLLLLHPFWMIILLGRVS
jgi:hypothetical protein